MTQITPVLEQILHPPLGFLQRELISGLFTGNGDLTRPGLAGSPFQHVNAYGLSWDFFTIPAGFGSEPGFPIIYEERMLQLSTVHTDLASHDLISEWHAFQSEGVYWLWENAGPTRVHYEIAPGVQVVFYWVIL